MIICSINRGKTNSDSDLAASDAKSGLVLSTTAAMLWACALALLLRLPILLNANAYLNSDEAVEFLAFKHLLNGTLPTLHFWGGDYMGLTDAALVFPLLCLFGWKSWVVKLSVILQLQILICAVIWLSGKLFGKRLSLVNLLILSTFNIYDTENIYAAGSFFLVPAMAILSMWSLVGAFCSFKKRSCVYAGLFVGFALYSSRQTLFWLLPSLSISFLWLLEGLLKRDRIAARVLITGLYLLFIGVGYSPHFIPFPPPSPIDNFDAIPHMLYAGSTVQERLLLLLQGLSCLCTSYAQFKIPPDNGASAFLGLVGYVEAMVLMSIAALAAISTLPNLMRKTHGRLSEKDWMLAWLVAVAFVDLTLCTFNENFHGAGHARYLLPFFISSLILFGAFDPQQGAVKTARKLLFTLCFAHIIAYTAWITSPAQPKDELTPVISLIRKIGIKVAFADYWLAYKIDFLGRECPLVAVDPYATVSHERSESFTHLVAFNKPRAYIYRKKDMALNNFFSRLSEYKSDFVTYRTGSFVIVITSDDRLLPDAERTRI